MSNLTHNVGRIGRMGQVRDFFRYDFSTFCSPLSDSISVHFGLMSLNVLKPDLKKSSDLFQLGQIRTTLGSNLTWPECTRWCHLHKCNIRNWTYPVRWDRLSWPCSTQVADSSSFPHTFCLVSLFNNERFWKYQFCYHETVQPLWLLWLIMTW